MVQSIEVLDLDILLHEIKLRVTSLFTNLLPKEVVYHNVALISRSEDSLEELIKESQLTERQKNITKIVLWLIFIGFIDLERFAKIEKIQHYYDECKSYSLKRSEDILTEKGIDLNLKIKILAIIEECFAVSDHKFEESKIIIDAILSDFAKPLSVKYIQKLYREFLLTGVVQYSARKWYINAIKYLTKHNYLTKYGQEVYEMEKINTIQKLEKKKKKYLKTDETLLQKEMAVSGVELKRLKKSLNKIKGRNERGIQTMFRTTSRNHYTLNQMIDRKANILISVNSIIISVIIGKLIGGKNVFTIENLPVLVLMFTALITILFAILAILPVKTHGEFSAKEIRAKEGNLLYFGNYHKMSFRDYAWGMLQMINDGEHLYMTMIRDLYFFGKQLNNKYTRLRIALFTMGIGFVLTIVLFLIVSFVPGSEIQ